MLIMTHVQLLNCLDVTHCKDKSQTLHSVVHCMKYHYHLQIDYLLQYAQHLKHETVIALGLIAVNVSPV